MSNPRMPRLAARIFPPPIPPRSHSLPSQPKLSNLNVTTASSAVIQQPAPAAQAPTHQRSHACHAPIIFHNREEKSRREQTEESEKARDDLMKQGIKVRDFQVEVDEQRFGNEHACGKPWGESEQEWNRVAN
ncbi:hypothetical protein G647_07416 [Cladophialophora carrionii CBS 160.54]|uniref:Uncharacterized protein n=1 Tax=Cladophialophora carrionii CBS 160.54 TaxID=1279043 RepID=V9D4Z1_9EURO|nr:uncharacterized protein G647_07416 [Cladophialophora carrionii CBS 160.54]ETI21072.1 hypothetical protein G647_07416 [Cladophialophora carrionii CBS 160.54]